MRHHPGTSARFWWRALSWIALLTLPGLYVLERYAIGIDGQDIRCLPDDSRAYLIDHAETPSERGQRIAFRTDDRQAPFFKPHTLMVKEVAAVAGDLVVLKEDTLLVNGNRVLSGLPLAKSSTINPSPLTRPQRLQPGEWLVMGRHPLSYDSRYWGLVYQDQLVGVAHAFPF